MAGFFFMTGFLAVGGVAVVVLATGFLVVVFLVATVSYGTTT